MSFTKVKIKYIIYILLFFAFASIGIDVVFKLKTTKHVPPTGVWAHRGLHIDHPQNTLEAFSAAMKSGFEGVELDVFFNEDLNQFIVSHDVPLSNHLDTFLTLEEVFASFEDSLYYWLDLKNLNTKNYPAVKENLERLSSKYPIKENLYIESANAIPLGKLAKAGFNTLYWVQYSREQPKRFLKLKLIKINFILFPYSGVSCQHDYCTNDFIKLFNTKNLFIFTINSQEEYVRLKPYMKVFLSDLTMDNFL
jgi:hypothetical protein